MTRPPLPPPLPPHDDWNDLAEVWTAPRDGPDMTADLVARMRRRAWLARINFHVEAWGAVVAGLVGGWVAWREAQPVLGGAAFVFAVFALVVTLWARRGAEPGLATTPREALEAAIAQARSGLRWARAGQAVTAAALAFLLVVIVGVGAWRAAWLYGPALVFVAVCAVFYERHARRARARIAGHQAALGELEDLA